MQQFKQFNYGYSSLTLRVSPHLQALKIGKSAKEKVAKELTTHGFLGSFQLFDKQEIQHTDTTTVYHPIDNNALVVPTGKLYLVFKNETTVQNFLNKHQLTLVEQLAPQEVIVSTTQNAVDLAIQLQKYDDILECAEPDLLVSTETYDFQLPTDELLPKQWYLDNTGLDPYGNQHWKYKKGADARVIEAWKILEEHKGFKSSPDITVAVIDKGFDLSHPDFQGKIVGARDFHAEYNSLIPKPFYISQTDVDHEGKIDTDADHGTSCAGIAIGAANGEGVVGAAPDSKFMPIRYHVANGNSFRKMFRHIMKHGGDVISCSFGHVGIPMDRMTMKQIHNCAVRGRNGRGCVILFATGNAFTMLKNHELATHSDVIAVGASTSEDTFAPYSNRTKNVSVVAPGGYGHSGSMTTSDVGFLDRLIDGERISAGKGREENPYYRNNAEGTSFACPLVAGVCALVLSANPDLTSFEVKQIIEETADKIGTPSEYDENGHSAKFGYGRVNAANAVRKALGLPLVEYKVESPNLSNIPDSLDVDYGIMMEGTHGDDLELVIQYPVLAEHVGKTLLIEVDTALDHDLTKEFELYIQKDRKPIYAFPEDFISKKMSPTPSLTVHNIQEGTYFLMLRCFDKKVFEYVKGGGDFEMNITLLPPMA